MFVPLSCRANTWAPDESAAHAERAGTTTNTAKAANLTMILLNCIVRSFSYTVTVCESAGWYVVLKD